MKKYFVFAVCAALFVGCGSGKLRDSVEPKAPKSSMQHDDVTYKFKDEKGKIITLTSADEFSTAILTDSDGQKYNLARQAAADGIYMENKGGVSIHFKGKEGIVEFKKYDSIPIEKID